MKALVTASFHPDSLKRLRRRMEAVHDDWRVSRRIYFDAQQLIERIHAERADVLIVEADLAHDEVLDACALKMIGCCRGDPINIGIERASALGIPVFFTPGRNADAVADLTLGYMLALARHIVTVNVLLKNGSMRFQSTQDYLSVYDQYGGFELGGAVIGIVGFGAIGKAVAKRLHGFGAHTLAFDPYVPGEIVRAHHAEPVTLDALLARCDILTVHCPDLPETSGLIGPAQIQRLKKGALVLNLARAAVIDDDALYDALCSGHVAGAALDVFRDEPLQPDNRFVVLANVIASPHLGGATRDVVRHQGEMIVDDIEAYLDGRRPQRIANPQVLEKR